MMRRRSSIAEFSSRVSLQNERESLELKRTVSNLDMGRRYSLQNCENDIKRAKQRASRLNLDVIDFQYNMAERRQRLQYPSEEERKQMDQRGRSSKDRRQKLAEHQSKKLAEHQSAKSADADSFKDGKASESKRFSSWRTVAIQFESDQERGSPWLLTDQWKDARAGENDQTVVNGQGEWPDRTGHSEITPMIMQGEVSSRSGYGARTSNSGKGEKTTKGRKGERKSKFLKGGERTSKGGQSSGSFGNEPSQFTSGFLSPRPPSRSRSVDYLMEVHDSLLTRNDVMVNNFVQRKSHPEPVEPKATKPGSKQLNLPEPEATSSAEMSSVSFGEMQSPYRLLNCIGRLSVSAVDGNSKTGSLGGHSRRHYLVIPKNGYSERYSWKP